MLYNHPKMYGKSDKVYDVEAPKKKKSGFCKYFNSLCKQSLITGFPIIVSTKNTCRKSIKAAVFLICTMGFIYQTTDFLGMYLAYPTIVDVQVYNPEYINLPAISVCIGNRLKRSAVCKENPDICEVPTNDYVLFCSMYKIYCRKKLKKETNYNVIQSIQVFDLNRTWAFTKELGYQTDDVIKFCHILTNSDITQCKNATFFQAANPIHGSAHNCYAIQSLWGQPDGKPKIVPTSTIIRVLFKTMPEELIIPSSSCFASILIHDPQTLGNPMIDGMRFEGGKKYSVYVDQRTKELLPPPYRSNCRNYTAEWIKNGGKGPLNKQMCIYKCKVDASIKQGLCVDPTISYPHTYPLCQARKKDSSLSQEAMTYCYKSCNQACVEHSYQMRAEITDNAIKCDDDDARCQVAAILVDFNFQRLEITRFKHQPKYENVEMFSYIGGYMGMWLGISLVALFDFLETMTYLISYPLKGKKNKLKEQEKAKFFEKSRNPPRQFYNNVYDM